MAPGESIAQPMYVDLSRMERAKEVLVGAQIAERCTFGHAHFQTATPRLAADVLAPTQKVRSWPGAPVRCTSAERGFEFSIAPFWQTCRMRTPGHEESFAHRFI